MITEKPDNLLKICFIYKVKRTRKGLGILHNVATLIPKSGFIQPGGKIKSIFLDSKNNKFALLAFCSWEKKKKIKGVSLFPFETQ